jgi:regulator of protease activity HflC (stomatin/prohibitin superfamily)
MESIEGVAIAVLVIGFALVFMAVKIVPQQEAWVIENFGKFDTVTDQGGLIFLMPFMQRNAYKHSLKEQVVDVREQTAITKDNVTLRIDGVLYVKVMDAKKASYGVSDPYLAVSQLAQTTMRAEIGKMTLERTFEERDTMNANIVNVINEAAVQWGVQCMRYEIRDITPPHSVLQAMELQIAADRQKRAEILNSEGKRQSQINVAEGTKQEAVLKSEGALIDQVNRAKGQAEAVVLNSQASKTEAINRAEGEAQAIRLVAEATAAGIKEVAKAIQDQGGNDAVALRVAEQYVSAFANLAKTTNTLLLPANTGDAGAMVAQALGVFNAVKKNAA